MPVVRLLWEQVDRVQFSAARLKGGRELKAAAMCEQQRALRGGAEEFFERRREKYPWPILGGPT